MIEDDILLLKQIQAKDEVAFKYLFDTYFVSLCRYVNLFVSDRNDGEELVLGIYIYLWENSSEVNLNLSLKAYLFRAAHNRCINYLRDRKHTVPVEEIWEMSDEGGGTKHLKYKNFIP